jgi:hypothetical protein
LTMICTGAGPQVAGCLRAARIVDVDVVDVDVVAVDARGSQEPRASGDSGRTLVGGDCLFDQCGVAQGERMGEHERHGAERVGDGLVHKGGTDQLVHGPSLASNVFRNVSTPCRTEPACAREDPPGSVCRTLRSETHSRLLLRCLRSCTPISRVLQAHRQIVDDRSTEGGRRATAGRSLATMKRPSDQVRDATHSTTSRRDTTVRDAAHANHGHGRGRLRGPLTAACRDGLRDPGRSWRVAHAERRATAGPPRRTRC